MPETDKPVETPEKELVSALRAFIAAQQNTEPEPQTHLGLADIVWLLMAFSCIVLVISFIPELFFRNEGAKFVLDKIVPWFLNLGTLAAVLKSPDAFLKTARNRYFRGAVPLLLLLLLVLTRDFFLVKAQVGGNATIWVDGRQRSAVFSLSPGHYDVELRSEDPSARSRHFDIGFRDFIHGFTLQPKWRLAYKIGVDPDEPMAVCFKPAVEFDEDFIASTESRYTRISKRAAEFVQQNEGGFDVTLLAGKYDVFRFKAACGIDQTADVRVGPAADKNLHFNKIACSRERNPMKDPCDDLIKAEGK